MQNDVQDILKTLKILIVEDETRLAQLLKDAISDSFFSVVTAKDGIEGLKKFKSFKPDIIITDILMPNCDGIDMTIQIKQFDENIPIIILSAHSDKDKLLKAIDLGISKYFIKPFDPDEVILHIKKIAPNLNKKKQIVLKENFIFDNNSINLYKNDELITLTKREKEFFYLLIKYKNNLVTTEQIKQTLLVNNIRIQHSQILKQVYINKKMIKIIKYFVKV